MAILLLLTFLRARLTRNKFSQSNFENFSRKTFSNCIVPSHLKFCVFLKDGADFNAQLWQTPDFSLHHSSPFKDDDMYRVHCKQLNGFISSAFKSHIMFELNIFMLLSVVYQKYKYTNYDLCGSQKSFLKELPFRSPPSRALPFPFPVLFYIFLICPS